MLTKNVVHNRQGILENRQTRRQNNPKITRHARNGGFYDNALKSDHDTDHDDEPDKRDDKPNEQPDKENNEKLNGLNFGLDQKSHSLNFALPIASCVNTKVIRT